MLPQGRVSFQRGLVCGRSVRAEVVASTPLVVSLVVIADRFEVLATKSSWRDRSTRSGTADESSGVCGARPRSLTLLLSVRFEPPVWGPACGYSTSALTPATLRCLSRAWSDPTARLSGWRAIQAQNPWGAFTRPNLTGGDRGEQADRRRRASKRCASAPRSSMVGSVAGATAPLLHAAGCSASPTWRSTNLPTIRARAADGGGEAKIAARAY